MDQDAHRSVKDLAGRLLGRLGRSGATNPAFWNVAGALNHRNVLHQLFLTLQGFGVRDHVLHQSHDCIPGVRWNGGRIIMDVQNTQQGYYERANVGEVIESFNGMGVGIYLTFSNHLLEEEHLADKRGNALLETISRNSQNGIICSSDLLLRHVRENYPGLKVKLSTIRSYVEEVWRRPRKEILDWHKARFDLYDAICLNPNLNKSYDLIEKLPLDRLEVMVSLPCFHQCPRAHAHYDSSARANLHGGTDFDLVESDYGYCMKHSAPDQPPDRPTVQLSTATVDRLRSLGVRHFKIHGKTESYWDLLLYVNYYILNPLGIYLDLQLLKGTVTATRSAIGRNEFE